MNGLDRFGKHPGAAIRQFVSIDGRNDGMPQTQRLHRLRDLARFFFIDCKRAPGRHCAIMAAAGANIAENQERRRPVIPAFPDVRTARLFADRMKTQRLCETPNLLIVRPPA